MDSSLTPAPNPQAPPPPPPNPALSMGQPSGLMPDLGQPGQPPTVFQQTLINRLMDMLPFNSQNQAQPLPNPAQAQSPISSTSSDRPSSTLSTEGEGRGTGRASAAEVAPDLDEDGFPRNEDYLREQGLTLSELNRAYVQQQEQSQQATDFITALTQADPQTAMQMIQEFQNTYQQEMQNQGFGDAQPGGYGQPEQPYQRPNFPGGVPNQPQYATPDQLFQQAVQMGNPLDQLEAVHGLWNQIPEDYIRSLAPYLIRES